MLTDGEANPEGFDAKRDSNYVRDLSNVVNLRRGQVIEQHHCNDRHGTGLCDLARFIEGQLATHHSREVNPFAKTHSSGLSCEASKPVNPVVTEATIPVARWVIQHVERVRKILAEAKEGQI